MKKILILLLFAGIGYAQEKNFKGTITADSIYARTVYTLTLVGADTTYVVHDSLAADIVDLIAVDDSLASDIAALVVVDDSLASDIATANTYSKTEYITLAIDYPETEDMLLFKVPGYEPLTIDTLIGTFLSDSTAIDTITFNIYFGTTLYTATDSLFSADRKITAEETIVSFNDNTIPANYYIWAKIEDVTSYITTSLIILKTRRQ